MRRTRSRSLGYLAGAAAGLVLALLLPAGDAAAQAIIRVNDDINVKFGILLQGQADWLLDPATDGYTQNLFLRRVRFLAGGSLAKNVTFFFETDNPNLGKVNSGAKTISTGLTVQDAFVSWKILGSDALIMDGGLFLTGIAHNSLQSAASLLPVDYGAYSFLFSAGEQNVVGRDTGFQLRGYPGDKHFEYRVGVWQGNRDSASQQSFRTTARIQYNFLEADTGVFYTGTSLGKKKILAVGGGCDFQKDYKSWAADVYFDHPLGPGSISAQLDWIRYDGGTLIKTLPLQEVLYTEVGYYFSSVKLMPFFTYGSKDITNVETGDETRWSIGIGFFPFGHNFNIKAAYGNIDPKNAKSVDQLTVQLQAFYF
jgi:hypothetical protein